MRLAETARRATTSCRSGSACRQPERQPCPSGAARQVRPAKPLLCAALHYPENLGKVNAWVANWPRQHDDGEEPGKAMKNILGRIDGRLGGIAGVDAALKRRSAPTE